MLLDVLALANGPLVMGAFARIEGPARFTDLRNASTGLGDSQVSRAIKELNRLGLVAGLPQADRTMRYSLTKAGREVLGLLHDVHAMVHAQKGPMARETDQRLERILVA